MLSKITKKNQLRKSYNGGSKEDVDKVDELYQEITSKDQI